MNIVRVAALAALVVVCAGCNVSVAAAGDTAAAAGGELEWMLVLARISSGGEIRAEIRPRPQMPGFLLMKSWRSIERTVTSRSVGPCSTMSWTSVPARAPRPQSVP